MHDAREIGDVCDFFLAETVSSIKVEQGDFAAEEWEDSVCGYLDGWPPAGATKGEGADVDCLVAYVAARGPIWSIQPYSRATF